MNKTARTFDRRKKVLNAATNTAPSKRCPICKMYMDKGSIHSCLQDNGAKEKMIYYEGKTFNDFKISDSIVVLIKSEGKASDLLIQGKLKWIFELLKRRTIVKPII